VQLQGLESEFGGLLGVERRGVGEPFIEIALRDAEVSSGSPEPFLGTCPAYGHTSHLRHHGEQGTYELSAKGLEFDIALGAKNPLVRAVGSCGSGAPTLGGARTPRHRAT